MAAREAGPVSQHADNGLFMMVEEEAEEEAEDVAVSDISSMTTLDEYGSGSDLKDVAVGEMVKTARRLIAARQIGDAAAHLEEALRIATETGLREAAICAQLGRLYWKMGNFERAEECYDQQLRVAMQAFRPEPVCAAKEAIAATYRHKAEFFLASGHSGPSSEALDRSRTLYKELLDYAKKHSYPAGVAQAYRGLGALSALELDASTAEQWYRQYKKMLPADQPRALAHACWLIIQAKNLNTLNHSYARKGIFIGTGLATAAGRAADVRSLLWEQAAFASECSDHTLAARAYLMLGQLHETDKEYAQACEWYKKGLESAQQLSPAKGLKMTTLAREKIEALAPYADGAGSCTIS